MDSLTPGEIVAISIGVLLAISGAVTTVGGAVEKIAKIFRAAKAPEKAQDAEITEIKTRLDKVEREQASDEEAIADTKECNRVLTKGMLALLEHGINGNNIDQMRDAKNDVEAYLINH